MSDAERCPEPNLFPSLIAAVLALVSLFAAIVTAVGAYVASRFVANGNEPAMLVWLVLMVVAFVVSVANIRWSVRLVEQPATRGFVKVVLVSTGAIISFISLWAATT